MTIKITAEEMAHEIARARENIAAGESAHILAEQHNLDGDHIDVLWGLLLDPSGFRYPSGFVALGSPESRHGVQRTLEMCTNLTEMGLLTKTRAFDERLGEEVDTYLPSESVCAFWQERVECNPEQYSDEFMREEIRRALGYEEAER
ncbi:hypothetical protein ACFYRW_02465 [Rhodococcus pyridinivorans]|uniref:hypothetical protein n=1 Tax=Rhodococcus pyridinivorans TaxID=103816 RepID=UPI003687A64E